MEYSVDAGVDASDTCRPEHLSKPGIASVPDIFLYSYVLGAAGCIALAAAMNADTRDFVADIRYQ